ncbi:hypothetical protein RD792_012280 [Penstemon davidsonii]|uniref:Uncharacterized protein n=1 Tax=Penstemon davidsonii TaxID=160366 RepID=A0ABR0CXC3_9LAMI|nr:hypothetical protein RD792_012280 [Penstemon davidsonii]
MYCAWSSRSKLLRICNLKVLDDAIVDGVYILSISIARDHKKTVFTNDLIAIIAFHDMEKIIVVCSAGKSDPSLVTVVNVAPWILTIVTTIISCDFGTYIF